MVERDPDEVPAEVLLEVEAALDEEESALQREIEEHVAALGGDDGAPADTVGQNAGDADQP